MLTGHDNWVRALAFHPGGRYLLSVSDDKTLRCWDLTQEGKYVRTLSDVHAHFVSSLRWAPSVTNASVAVNGEGATNGMNRISTSKNAAIDDVRIRCVIATGSVDLNVRIFAN